MRNISNYLLIPVSQQPKAVIGHAEFCINRKRSYLSRVIGDQRDGHFIVALPYIKCV